MTDYTGLFRTMIAQYGLFEGEEDRLATVKGWCEVESNFDPWAIRIETEFYRRYVRPMQLPETEEYARSMSWGLFQIMGQTAREFGFDGKYLSELCNPITNGDLAGKVLADRYEKVGSWDGALAAYNGGLGGNRHPPYRRQAYADKVRAAAERFRGE